MRKSGGADLNGGAESHEPGSTGEDGFEPGAKGVASGAIDVLKVFVQLEPLDAEPLVPAGHVGTEPTARFRIGGLVEPALGEDTSPSQHGRTGRPAGGSRVGLYGANAFLDQRSVFSNGELAECGRRRERQFHGRWHAAAGILSPEEGLRAFREDGRAADDGVQ